MSKTATDPTLQSGPPASAARNLPTLIVLLGPTGVGKTELSLRLAERLHAEIISADSRQLYADIPIGTAAPTAEERARVPHHLVGTLRLEDYYSAARYEEEALALIRRLHAEGKRALLCGGSMMYIDAVCRGIDDLPTIPPGIRAHYAALLQEEHAAETLCRELLLRDPEYYAQVDRRNLRRVAHALEIIEAAGQTYTSLRRRSYKPRPFRTLKIGLDRPRPELFARIGARTEQMLHDGLLDEVRRVYPLRHLNSLNTVGYKELFRVVSGEWALPFALERMKKNTRVYAKKQLTWFRRDPSIHWFHPAEEDRIVSLLHSEGLL